MIEQQGMNTTAAGRNNNVVTIDLGEVFGVLWHWAWLLALVTLICGLAGFAFSTFVLPEEFDSTTKIYILNRSDDNNSSVNYSDIQAGTQLTKDYAELITSRNVIEKVIQDLNLPYTYDEFLKKVTVETPTDTRIVSITVRDTDPKLAQTMADEVRIEASDHIKKVMDIDAVNVVEEANLPEEKASPSRSRWTIVAALIGFLVTAAVIIIQYILDDSIKTSDDIQKYLGLSTLALIPLDLAITENSVEAKSRKKGRRTREKSSHRDAGTERQREAGSYNRRAMAERGSVSAAGAGEGSHQRERSELTENRQERTKEAYPARKPAPSRPESEPAQNADEAARARARRRAELQRMAQQRAQRQETGRIRTMVRRETAAKPVQPARGSSGEEITAMDIDDFLEQNDGRAATEKESHAAD